MLRVLEDGHLTRQKLVDKHRQPNLAVLMVDFLHEMPGNVEMSHSWALFGL